MPVLFLIRHGENDYVKSSRLAGWLPDVHLNEKGHAQAQVLADKLSKIAITAIYSSPLERAMETAEPLGKVLGIKVIPRDGLLETDYGEWQGKSLKVLRRRKLWRVVQEAPSQMRFPGGESFLETQLRICKELESLTKQHITKEIIVCVTHADPIRLAVAHYLGMPLDLFQRLMVSPGSITVLRMSGMGGQLICLNINPISSFIKS
jgi:probable phosphoglycerate mutase